MKSLTYLAGVLGAAILLAPLAGPVHAQSDGTVSIVVPYGPGGNGDLAARSLAAVLMTYNNAPSLVVMNRPGANGIIGSQAVANAPADGRTLLLARVGSAVVAPALDPAATYKWDNFTFLGLLETDPYACIVAKDSPYKSFQDLVAAMKANPGKITYATSGSMDASAVFAKKMLINAGLSADTGAVMVPYKSGAETLSAVLGGHVDFSCNGLQPYLGAIVGDQVRGIVVSTPTRVAQVPNVPTAEEVGMKNLGEVVGWSALFGPPNLPKDVVAKWADYLKRVSQDSTWSDQVTKRGAIPAILTPEETHKFVGDQFNVYSALRQYIKP